MSVRISVTYKIRLCTQTILQIYSCWSIAWFQLTIVIDLVLRKFFVINVFTKKLTVRNCLDSNFWANQLHMRQFRHK